MLKDKPAGKKTSLAKLWSFGWNSGKKGEYIMSSGRSGRPLRRTTRIS